MLTEPSDWALSYASRFHREHALNGFGTPYVSRLPGMASVALETGAGEDQEIAALQHGAVEDQITGDRNRTLWCCGALEQSFQMRLPGSAASRFASLGAEVNLLGG